MAYTIKQGDNLSAIARANNTTVDELLKLNPNITNPNLIRAGASLNLPQISTQVQATPQSVPQAPNYADIFKQAGAGGFGFDEVAKYISTPQDETQKLKDDLARQYGYESFDKFTADVFQKPSKPTQQLYEEAYNAAGLGDLLKKITEGKQKLTDAEGRISENPWLDEASRVGRTKRLQELASGQLGNFIDEYNTKLGEVSNLVQRNSQDFTNNQKIDEARLNFLLKQVEEKALANKNSLLSKYLPDFLKSRAPQTVTLPDGTLATWEPNKNAFVPVNTSQQENITATADQIAAAFRQKESSNNYTAKGASGEFGAYQFMPSTWSQWSKEYLIATEGKANRSLSQTPQNQDAVATFKIQRWLDQGYNVAQIASMWNSGSPDPTSKVGVNKYGVAYNTPEYVKQFMNILSQTSGSSSAPKLPKAGQERVDSFADKFRGEPITKLYNEVQNKYLSFQGIIDSGVGGPGDLAIVYEFMKALDPTSVVRETEYESAAKSGNIFRGALTRFNGYLKENGGFLPDSVKQAFLDIVTKKFQVATQQYRNLRSEYARKINDVPGVNGAGERYLIDYEKAGSIDSIGGSSFTKADQSYVTSLGL